MARDINLNALKSGINRLRTKGGADPSSLYDLVNGYVTIDGSIQSRPGTINKVTLPAGTKGLCAFQGGFVVFSHQSTPIATPGYRCEVLVNPNDADQPIKEIHFAAPFMGSPYVVAEFANGEVFHYWLQSSAPWKADTVYHAGDIVEPTTPNGLAYQAVRMGNAYPSWEAGAPRELADKLEPTVYNDYYYTAIEVDGANPASGATEPVWPTSEGAQVIEDTDGTGSGGASTTRPPSTDRPGSGTSDRYAGLPGYKQDQLDRR